MKLRPTCREVARAVSSDELLDLAPWRRLLMRWHLFVCRDCRRYARQIEAIGRTLRDMTLRDGTDMEAETLQSLEAKVLEELADGTGRPDEGMGDVDGRRPRSEPPVVEGGQK